MTSEQDRDNFGYTGNSEGVLWSRWTESPSVAVQINEVWPALLTKLG